MRRLLAIGALLLTLAAGAFAQEATEPYARADDPREQQALDLNQTDFGGAGTIAAPGLDLGTFILSVAVWLVICIALIYGIAYLLKFIYRRFPGSVPGGMLEPLGSVAVAPGLAVHLVRLHDVVLVLGATSNAVTLLDRVEDPERVALLVRAFTPKNLPPNPHSFQQALQRAQEPSKVWVVGDEDKRQKVEELKQKLSDWARQGPS